MRLDILWVCLAMCLEQITKAFLGVWRLRSGKWVKDVTRTGES